MCVCLYCTLILCVELVLLSESRCSLARRPFSSDHVADEYFKSSLAFIEINPINAFEKYLPIFRASNTRFSFQPY